MVGQQRSRSKARFGSTLKRDLFGRAPLLAGENTAAYDDLHAQVSTAAKPADAIEDIWVRDVVDLTWEILRWRRLKAVLLSQQIRKNLEHILTSIVNKQPVTMKEPVAFTFDFVLKTLAKSPESSKAPEPSKPPSPTIAQKLASKCYARDPAAIKQAEKLLASQNLSIDAVIAQVIMEKFDDVERIDRLVVLWESHRNTILREIARRSESFAQTLHGTVKNAEDRNLPAVGRNVALASNKNAA